jgi:hypothetical protein
VPANGEIWGNALVPALLSLLTTTPEVKVNGMVVFSPSKDTLSTLLGQYATFPVSGQANTVVYKGDKITQSNMSTLYFAPYK